MRGLKIHVFAILALPLTVSVIALSLGSARTDRSRQSSPQAPTAPSPSQAPSESAKPQTVPPGPRRATSQRQTPCWCLAGIAPEVVNQRWHIEDNAKGKINTVCADPALTAEKKREKIQEINQQTEQEIAKIIPAKQLEASKACQAERDQEEAKHHGAKVQKELGPCGGVIPRSRARLSSLTSTNRAIVRINNTNPCLSGPAGGGSQEPAQHFRVEQARTQTGCGPTGNVVHLPRAANFAL